MGTALLLFLLCLATSVAGAISGIGGGVILKPLLDALTDYNVATISFFTGCMVLSMSVVSMLRSRGSGVRMEARRGTLLALGAVAGGLVGKSLFDQLRQIFAGDRVVGAAQSAILLLMTLAVFVYIRKKEGLRSRDVQAALPCVLIGMGLGLISSFLGIGGGPLNIMILSYCLGMDSKSCALHSLYIILLSQITSMAKTLAGGGVPGDLDVPVLLAMVMGGILGGLAGSQLMRRLSNRQVDGVFSGILVVVVVVSAYNFVGFVTL